MESFSQENIDLAKSILLQNPSSKIKVIKVIRERTGLGLKESKALVDYAQVEVLKDHPDLITEKKGCFTAALILIAPLMYFYHTVSI